MRRNTLCSVLFISLFPFCLAAKGDGCSSSSRSPAPDLSGDWVVTYDNMLDVTIRIAGKSYEGQVSNDGGTIDIVHEGRALSFDLSCERPEIVCPSEAWPSSISIEQRSVQFGHRMIVTLPEQECSEPLMPAVEQECGADTLNPDCEAVCPGEIRVVERDRFGVIGEDGSSFRLYLGAGLATNGINCALLGVSLADANLVNSGGPDTDDWRAEEMSAGLVTVAYGGACLWVGDPDMDQELEALVLGASVEFRTGFTGLRL